MYCSLKRWADGLGGNKGHGEGRVHELVKRGRCRRDLGTGRLDVGLKLSGVSFEFLAEPFIESGNLEKEVWKK